MAYQNTKLPALSEQDIQRFWSKVDKTPGQGPKGECWRFATNQPYGHFWIKNRNYPAHRVAYFLQTGNDPSPYLVCHTCDYKHCCREDHLFTGTILDNNRDRYNKGGYAKGDESFSRKHRDRMARGDKVGRRKHPERYPVGERTPAAKLTEDIVRSLRHRYWDKKEKIRHLAKEVGVNMKTAWAAIHGITWKHII